MPTNTSAHQVSRVLKLDVVSVVVHTLRVDLEDPQWSWLADVPADQRAEVLREEANTTEGAFDEPLARTSADGAWREVVLGDARIRIDADPAGR